MNVLTETHKSSERPAKRAQLWRRSRAYLLMAVTLTLMTITAVLMLAVATVTLFRARRFYTEVMAKRLAHAILWVWGVGVVLHQDKPFPETQTIYISNHTSTLDMFVLVSLGLPCTRFFLWGKTRKWLPMAVIAYLMGTFFTPPQAVRADRVRCFQRADRILRKTGDSVYLSPEGDRITGGKIGPFNKGAFHLATSLRVPIVPLYIAILRETDPGRGYAAGSGTVHVYVKPAIPTDQWRLEDLEKNKETVRALFERFHSELRAG